MALNFPNNPSTGQTHNAANGVTYRYDGEKWITQGSYMAAVDPDAEYVNVSGDTMTGDLTVDGTVQVAGDPNNGTAAGNSIDASGGIKAARSSGSQAVFRGYQVGTSGALSVFLLTVLPRLLAMSKFQGR